MADNHEPMTEEEIARDERLCSANERLLKMLDSAEPVNINDEIAAYRDLANFRTTYDTGWPRALAEVRRLRGEVRAANKETRAVESKVKSLREFLRKQQDQGKTQVRILSVGALLR